MDEQELAEREEAADAYAGEDETHFVDYCDACVKESMAASKEIRQIWSQCHDALQGKIDYGEKEDWQSKVITNEPYITTQQAKAVIRKALLRHNYFNIEGVELGDRDYSGVMNKSFEFWLNPNHADFPTYFADACDMGLGVGQSMEIIPSWNNGLTLDLIEPWKIHRDPDAIPRNPWSGMYWIHEEWMDLWKLKQDYDVKNLEPGGDESDQRKAEERKGMYYKRSDYRKLVRVREFWGVVLDKNGEMLLPNATYTVGANKIIKQPEISPYVKARWPGVSFSPFVHLLRFQGKGLIEGVISLWWLMCNLMNLDVDNMNWVVNKMGVIDPSKLIDPSDLSTYPGKNFLALSGQGKDVYNEIDSSANTQDVLARLQYWSQKYENGSLVNQFVAGLPGTRSDITKGEVEIKTQQSLGTFDSIGKDLEQGGVNTLWLIYETILLNWLPGSGPSVQRVFGQEYDTNEEAKMFASMTLEQREELLKSNCDISITGISAELQKLEKLQRLEALARMAESETYREFVKPHKLLSQITETYGFYDPDFILNDEEVQQLMFLKGTQFWQMLLPEQQQALLSVLRNIDFEKMSQIVQGGLVQ